ncbi:SusC/RagA family TonB-linked outer membrane protein [Salegentibacter sp. UBA1130]|uniref:SusC/RagA family TonB-linked outer membrane protein n=1 Tax=Salegentibacter sp. UBA1130 TaxID=1947451 RepID=UPI00257AFC00|nr:SusC/RagA family TonB-linked outer membrane protein [Salegentibacter sp. UBA1130]
MKNNYSRLKWVALIILGGIFFFLSMAATAATTTIYSFQEQEVSGIVRDQNGLPIPGVTITVKNTNRGTVTNLDGEYEISASSNGTLVFSYLGFKTFELEIDGRVEINIQLEEDIASLATVKINAGYYNTTERESTGNISKVSGEEIEKQPLVNPLQALQGRMAGVEILPRGDLPGQASRIRIRGTNSLREEGNFPLYIVDGVPINSTPLDSRSIAGSGTNGFDPLNTLNLSNIESIEVLKDADATAIYGSRGANGVVLISTKKGTEGETNFEAALSSGVSQLPNKMDLLNTSEYLQIRRRAFENDGVEPTQFNAYDLLLWDQERYTDWQDFFYGGNAPVTDLNVSATGGNANTTFRVGGSYYTQGSIYPGSYDYNKVTGSLNLNHITNDEKLRINLSVGYGVDDNQLAGSIDVSSAPFRLPPNAPRVFNSDGSLHWEEWAAAGQNNPLAGFFNQSDTRVNNLISSLSLTYKLATDFNFKINAGYTNLQSKELVKRPSRSFNPAWNYNDDSQHLDINRSSWILEPQLTYSRSIGDGILDLIAGATFQQNRDSNLELIGSGYVSEALIGNLNAAEDINSTLHLNTQYSYNAVFGRLAYNFKSKYLVNLTGRRDGSSRFGPGKRFANFGAVGAAWIFTEEPFIKKSLPFLSFGKLRGSYGTTGNDQIGDYGYLDAYEVTPGPGGLFPTQLFNPNYSWEENKKLEAAFEAGFFKDRLNFGVSWYRNRSSNQLVGFPLPAMTGFNSVQANLPATVENSGWEIELSSLNFNAPNFRWRTSFNISIPENRLVSYPGIESSSYANRYRVGEPLNIALLFKYGGLDPDTGFYTREDINGDGRFDYEDRVVTKDLGRQYFGGINNSISYKSFNLQFLWQFVKQEGNLFNFNAGNLSNQRQETLQALEPGSRYQRVSQSIQGLIGYAYVQTTPFPYTDASFLRLKTLTLGYEIPTKVLNKVGVKKGSLSLHGQNLLTITDYKGVDPEMPIGGTSFAGLRTIIGGIKLNF